MRFRIDCGKGVLLPPMQSSVERGNCLMKAGCPFPLGATVTANGVNFSIFSSRARAMHLLLFEGEDAKTASHVIELAPETNLTGHYWHVEVPGIGAGQIYAYRAYGPDAPGAGSRFDGDKVLLDPYGKAVCAKHYDRKQRRHEASPLFMKALDPIAAAFATTPVNPGANTILRVEAETSGPSTAAQTGVQR